MCKLRALSILSHSLYTFAYIAIALIEEGRRYQNVGEQAGVRVVVGSIYAPL
jgi:hypothetical protein